MKPLTTPDMSSTNRETEDEVLDLFRKMYRMLIRRINKKASDFSDSEIKTVYRVGELNMKIATQEFKIVQSQQPEEKESEWIDVNEELPKIGVNKKYPYASKDVWGSDGEKTRRVFYESGTWNCAKSKTTLRDFIVIKWKPLPTKPQPK